jgi:phage terminase small subunit
LGKNAAMTPKQKAFVQEYLVDLNATKAAIRAGYSKRTAHVIGYENLSKPEITAAIHASMNERSRRTEITADYVLEGIKDTVERCRGEGTEFNPSQALKGFELLAKHLGLFAEKYEHNHIHAHQPRLDRYSPDERRNMLADRLRKAFARIAVDKPEQR